MTSSRGEFPQFNGEGTVDDFNSWLWQVQSLLRDQHISEASRTREILSSLTGRAGIPDDEAQDRERGLPHRQGRGQRCQETVRLHGEVCKAPRSAERATPREERVCFRLRHSEAGPRGNGG